MPSQKGTLWNEFEEGGKYKINKTHKEAWCKWCINAKAEELNQEDTLAQEKGAAVLIRTRGTLRVEGEYFILIVSLRSRKYWCWQHLLSTFKYQSHMGEAREAQKSYCLWRSCS
jgi:hypothetical protein